MTDFAEKEIKELYDKLEKTWEEMAEAGKLDNRYLDGYDAAIFNLIEWIDQKFKDDV
jgi:hypothetical protein